MKRPAGRGLTLTPSARVLCCIKLVPQPISLESKGRAAAEPLLSGCHEVCFHGSPFLLIYDKG